MRGSLLNHTGVISDFNSLLKEQTERVFSLPFFVALSQGLSSKQWCLYAKQFHVTCNSFDKLLNATVENVRKTDHAFLIAELEENLADEMGKNPLKKVPHSILRKNFFRAIGLLESEMMETPGQIPLLRATDEHTAKVDEIINDGCVYRQIGAFTAQEFLACGPGFLILKSGVRRSFPELIDQPNDAMNYVYDHIEGDAMEHFPHLLETIEPLMRQSDIKQKIFSGATAMLNTEWNLYAGFEQDILRIPG